MAAGKRRQRLQCARKVNLALPCRAIASTPITTPSEQSAVEVGARHRDPHLLLQRRTRLRRIPERSGIRTAALRTPEWRIEQTCRQSVRILGAAMRTSILQRLVVYRAGLRTTLMNDRVMAASQAASAPGQSRAIPPIACFPLETGAHILLSDAKESRRRVSHRKLHTLAQQISTHRCRKVIDTFSALAQRDVLARGESGVSVYRKSRGLLVSPPEFVQIIRTFAGRISFRPPAWLKSLPGRYAARRRTPSAFATFRIVENSGLPSALSAL